MEDCPLVVGHSKSYALWRLRSYPNADCCSELSWRGGMFPSVMAVDSCHQSQWTETTRLPPAAVVQLWLAAPTCTEREQDNSDEPAIIQYGRSSKRHNHPTTPDRMLDEFMRPRDLFQRLS